MPENVETKEHSNDPERSDIQDNSSDKAEQDEDTSGAGIAPTEKRMESLKLSDEVGEGDLDATSKAAQTVIAIFDDFRGFRGRVGVELLIEFVF